MPACAAPATPIGLPGVLELKDSPVAEHPSAPVRKRLRGKQPPVAVGRRRLPWRSKSSGLRR
eukprot:13084428-Alexandrium_andersonii.AAC.1